MKRIHTTLIFLFLMAIGARSQQVLDLSKAIELARLQSVDAAVALNELKTAYWEYRTYRADYLPEVSLEATLPNYQRSYNLYQTEDGDYKYVRSNLLQMSSALSIDQNLWLTGGKLSLNTSLQYMDPLAGNSKHYFMSVPLGITLSQPLFGINEMKWKRRIEPTRYKEAKAAYIENTEEVTLKAINLYFQLLLAKENVNIALQNKINSDKLLGIAETKRKMGQLSENELLQLKLSALKATSEVTNEQSGLKAAMFQLRAFLGLSENDSIDPVIPNAEYYSTLEYNSVLQKAKENNAFAQNVRRRQLEADYQVAKANGEQRDIEVFASFGYTGQDEDLYNTYRNPIDYQVVQIGIKSPILDWGKRKGKVKVAESNREVIISKLKQEQLNFNQNVFLLVEQFNNQSAQLKIAEEADEIAQKRYKTSIESFMIGKINTLDLNDAQLSKDEARSKHISELHLYWYYMYQIRSLTLYDFEKSKDITAEFESLVRR